MNINLTYIYVIIYVMTHLCNLAWKKISLINKQFEIFLTLYVLLKRKLPRLSLDSEKQVYTVIRETFSFHLVIRKNSLSYT